MTIVKDGRHQHISKLLRSNGFLALLTGLVWLLAMVYRLTVGDLAPQDASWMIWVGCNNVMLLCLGYQLRCVTITWGDRLAEKVAFRPPHRRWRGFTGWLARWYRPGCDDDAEPPAS